MKKTKQVAISRLLEVIAAGVCCCDGEGLEEGGLGVVKWDVDDIRHAQETAEKLSVICSDEISRDLLFLCRVAESVIL